MLWNAREIKSRRDHFWLPVEEGRICDLVNWQKLSMRKFFHCLITDYSKHNDTTNKHCFHLTVCVARRLGKACQSLWLRVSHACSQVAAGCVFTWGLHWEGVQFWAHTVGRIHSLVVECLGASICWLLTGNCCQILESSWGFQGPPTVPRV